MTLAGIRRYAVARGWTVEAVPSDESRPEDVPSLLAAYHPVIGCVVDCSDDSVSLPPRLFGTLPVVYLHPPPSLRRNRATFVATDNEAVARAAFRELSAARPPVFAVAGVIEGLSWSRERERTFVALAAKASIECRVFGTRSETKEARAARLADWVATLPRHTAVFAVNDFVAADVVAAAAAAHRGIPRDLTLLGVDNNTEICESSHPTVSSIEIDHERAGHVAARLLAATMTDRAARGMTDRAARGMTDRAARGMTGRALRGMTTAAVAANDDALRANDGALCANGKVSSLPATPARHCGVAARHCAIGASSLQGADGDGGSAVTVGPLMAVWRESTRGSGRHDPHILAAVERIRREACDGLSAREVIAAAPGSRSLFNLRFREAMGHSVLDEIRHVRLEKVETLLASTDTPINALASLCGWGTDGSLKRFFLSRTGMTMREWRRRNRG